MNKRILITGGAGFIGSHLADELLSCGYHVRALDNLSPQVHGAEGRRPAYLNSGVELIVGDVRDREAVRRALKGVDGVCHLAAMVGVGQSMYEIAPYTEVNNLGTAMLLRELSERPVERLVVASSMSLYGEGLYQAPDGSIVGGAERSLAQLKSGDWEVLNADGEALTPIPTPETKSPSLASIYALSKYDQERICLLVGRAYNIPTVALRFFNVFGIRQAVSNPYTGVLAIFASRLLNGNPPPLVFTSTNKVYGGLEDVALRQAETRYEPEDPMLRTHGISEQRPLDFHSPYGCSKGAADQYVCDYTRTYSLPAVTFRMSCIYGPHQFGTEDQGWLAYFLICALEERPLTVYGDGKQVRDALFVGDLINALLLAQKQIDVLAGRSFNIGGGPLNTISLNELIDMIGELRGRRPEVGYDEWRVGDQRYYVCDTRKFQTATGWRPQVSVRDGVARLYQWLRESRGLNPLRTAVRQQSR